MQTPNIYIQTAEQISIQQPLSEEWMTNPIFHAAANVPAINPSFNQFLAPNVARRMSGLMKRALATAIKVINDTGVKKPDAIITGTCMGSLYYTEKFLDAMTMNGEQALSPTHFMQSTHNTVSSTLGIHTKNHNYNVTYSHGNLSFDLALFDAWIQLRLGLISNALVGGHDEMVDSHFELMKKSGFYGMDGMVPCGEVAVSTMLTKDPEAKSLCRLASVTHGCFQGIEGVKQQLESMLSQSGLQISDIDAVMLGTNGNPLNDEFYNQVADALFSETVLLHYKHIFGENYTSSALGVYSVAHCLNNGIVPEAFYCDTAKRLDKDPGVILLINHYQGVDYSLILLRRI